jgi:RNA polymerase sigma-70 factor, ECF subfamily
MAAASGSDRELVAALRRGDEAAFTWLVDEYGPTLLRVARMYVPTAAVAEEVVQETWIGVLEGIDRFEGRSSLKTWIFRILVNRARTRAVREQRTVPVSSIGEPEEAAVSGDRFWDSGHQWAGHWSHPPSPWSDLPADRVVGAEIRRIIDETVGVLPANQRAVVTLRDIHSWTSGEVCDLLGVSEGNQRVLLHRGRSRVRSALERYFAEADR